MKKKIAAFLGILMMSWGMMLSLAPNAAYAASGCDKSFMGFRAWYYGLTESDDCTIAQPGIDEDGSGIPLATFVWTIVLNIMSSLMAAVGYIASGFVLYSGYHYITAHGDPNKVVKAKKILVSAIIGIAIAVMANLIINTIVAILTAGAS